jgi:hypothetical protein
MFDMWPILYPTIPSKYENNIRTHFIPKLLSVYSDETQIWDV